MNAWLRAISQEKPGEIEMPVKKVRIAGFKAAGYMDQTEMDWKWYQSSKEFLENVEGLPRDGLPSQIRETLWMEGMSGGMTVKSWTSTRYPSGASYELIMDIKGKALNVDVLSSLEAAGMSNSIRILSAEELTLEFDLEGEFGVSEEEFEETPYDPSGEEENAIY